MINSKKKYILNFILILIEIPIKVIYHDIMLIAVIFIKAIS